MKKYYRYLTLGLILIFSGCGNDPQEANKKNFANAISDYIKSDKSKLGCINVYGLSFQKYAQENYEKLSQEGILTFTVNKIKPKKNLLTGELMTEGRTYSVSEKAKPFYKNNQICIGQVELQEIVQFTKPVQVMKFIMSEVTYKYKVSYPSWVRGKDSEIKKEKRGLILTNNGWVHEKLYQ